VHVSTQNAFGDTGYRVVDETYERPRPYRYVSYYDETKHRAHLIAHERMDAGASVLIAMPGGVYGPGDHSSLGGVLHQAATGKLPSLTFGDLGLNMAHVEDTAEGIALVGEKGSAGETFVLGGELTTMAELVRRVAAIAAQRPPRLSTPTWALRAAAPIMRRIGPDLGEIISASAGVTYWGTDAKARRELGYAPRDLEAGLTAVFGT
jgi:nucleoside-diphosphate-sugar epimerase